MVKDAGDFNRFCGYVDKLMLFPSCHTPIFDLRLYSGGVSLINGGT